MFYSKMECDGVVLIWRFLSTREIHQIKTIANICQSTVPILENDA
jgi:hypothetical protein